MATLRAAELEVLFTADTSQVEKADKDVKSIGERIEKKPIKATVTADEKDALAGMDRVEQAAKKLVSADTALKLDADVTRAEKSLDRAKQRLADLEVRALGGLDVTADVRRAEANLQKVGRQLDGLRTARSKIEIEADTEDALDALHELGGAVENVVSRDTAIRINADVDKAQNNITGMVAQLAILRAMDPNVQVSADIRRAQIGLEKARSELKALEGARATMVVEVDGDGAKKQLVGVADYAGEAGDDAGSNFGLGIIGALATIPIVGAVVGIGAEAAKALVGALNDGLKQEASYDRLQGLTGISEADALRLGRAAGEAYANVFGESVEANMDTARLALQFNLIDADASTKSAQKVVEGLSGIADVLGEDVRPIAAAVSTLLSSGVAKSAQGAFDLLATGAREGVNRGEDLLDTFTEYPAVFARLGLTGEEALGLISQGLDAGARNSDIAADALKEFQIRATDASKTSTEGYKMLGLSAEDMTAKISRGGAEARDGLDLVLTKLRETEDPVVRNAAAVALFGTKAEDLGAALFAMDLSTAVDQLNGVTGSAQKMFDTLSDNDATKMEQAQRNIGVAADGIKGALAAAFSEPLGDLATFVSENRGPVLQFLLDMANGALDFGVFMVEAAANGSEALGEFIAGPGSEMVDLLIQVQKFINPFADTSALEDMRDEMKEFDTVTALVADTMRTKLIDQGIEPARVKLNEFGDGAVAMGFLNDASLRLANAISEVGFKADGAAIGLDSIDLANLRASGSGKMLEDQVRNSIAAMAEEVDAAATAGEGQDQLAERYRASTDAIVGQLVQMGLTEAQARALIDTVLQTPASATTAFGSNAVEQQGIVQSLAERITTLPDGSVVIKASTDEADEKFRAFINRWNGATVNLTATGSGKLGSGILGKADGGLVEFMAQGGIRGLTSMDPVAQVVPANTWRVVGDRGDVPESYIPLDGSARSMAILLETMSRMGVMAAGSDGGASVTASQVTHNHTWQITTSGDAEAAVKDGIRQMGLVAS